MISAKLTSDLALLKTSTSAAAPLDQATPLLKAALVSAGKALVTEIDGELIASVGRLDSDDPTGSPIELVNALLNLSTANYDQASLADMRGTVGRAVFNLVQT